MDPEKGVVTGREPLLSLRRIHADADGNPLFGVHAIPRFGRDTGSDADADADCKGNVAQGCITVGQEAVVVRRK